MGWLAEEIDAPAPAAEEAIAELSRLEETRSRDELLYLLEKGIAYHNADLSWEERNLIESFLKKGEIKIICATTTLSMGINLPFKNVILSVEKYISDNGDYKSSYRTSLSLADVENMGGRAGRLSWKKEEFGRVIFLADSLFAETVLQNIFFKFMEEDSKRHREMIGEDGELYLPALKSGRQLFYRPVKKERDFSTFLLKAIVDGENSKDKLKEYLKRVTTNFQESSSYWAFDFETEDLEKEVDLVLEKLLAHHLITEELSLSPTDEGILICARGIGIKTYLYFKEYLENKKGKLSNLEIITLIALCEEGKKFFISFPQFTHTADRYNWNNWKGEYYRKMRQLVLEAEEEYKELYQDIFDDENGSLETEDFLSIKKIVLLHDWIGEKEIRELEEEHKIYGGPIQKLGEEFSWLADALGGVAESMGWDGNKEGLGSKGSMLTEEDETKKDNLGKIKVLSERLAWGVEEEGLKLARIHIPGLSRNYIRALLREGYDDEGCLGELSVEGLAKVVPERLAERIKKRFPAPAAPSATESSTKEDKLVTENRQPKTENIQTETNDSQFAPCTLQPVLEIDIHRPDRIIFTGEEIEVTSTEFSLIYFLAQHNNQVMSYDTLLDELWKDEEEAIYTRIISHIYKFRRKMLNAIGHNKENKEKAKNIFKVIAGRGVMLNINDDKLQIN